MVDDIAENALGITSAIKVRFDSRKVVNRTLEDVLKHALFQNRVDMEQDRIGSNSPYLLGAKHVADIVRTIAVGIDGRIGRRLESELTEGALVEKTNNFADALIEGFPVVDELVRGTVSAEHVRKTSLLGSTTMLRVLAGVYHELTTDLEDDELAEFFSKLAPVMGAPIRDGSPWLETGVFSVGATAPKARRQDLKALTEKIARWARSEPAWVKAA
jgi:hypothetical protein